MGNKLIIVYVTCPVEQAESIAQTLVESKLAACVNILPAKSIYFWQGKLCHDEEALLLIKSRIEVYDKLEAKIKQIHPYDVPEIVAVKAEKVSKDYQDWVDSLTMGGRA